METKKPVDINKYLSWVLRHKVVTTHPIFKDEFEVVNKNGGQENIIGIDTGLAWWQIYRTRKDWKNADRVKEIINKMGYNPAFLKDKYEAHVPIWNQELNNKQEQPC